MENFKLENSSRLHRVIQKSCNEIKIWFCFNNLIGEWLLKIWGSTRKNISSITKNLKDSRIVAQGKYYKYYFKSKKFLQWKFGNNLFM